ncbi:MAG: flagellar biosynthesis protein FlhB [Pseudomonadota bacterium]
MAESEDRSTEPTEAPTPKRLRDARDKGQIARSRELTTMAVTLSAAATIYVFGDTMLDSLVDMFSGGLSIDREMATDPRLMFAPLANATTASAALLLPLLIVVTIVSILSPMALGGWSFSVEALAFKGERINPLKGLKRLFAMRGLVELLKALAKFLLVAAIGIVVLQSMTESLLALGRQPLVAAISSSGMLMSLAFVLFSTGLIIIAAVDVPFQRWDHEKKLRMTRQEVRDEAKEIEGRPEVRARIRQLQQEAAGRRMLDDIPEATVVITNPTHFAVALRYEAEHMNAPIVVAKGADLLAARIRERANEHRVPIFEAPPLARALFRTAEIGEEIPADLYIAVAQVLSYLFQLDAYMARGGAEPRRPTIDVEGDEPEGTV